MPHETKSFVQFAVDFGKMSLKGGGPFVVDNDRLGRYWRLTVKVYYATGKQPCGYGEM